MEVVEYVFIAFWASFLLFDIVATIFVFINREYSPFKAKQVPVIVVKCIAGVLWYPGLLQALKFSTEGAFSICILWSIWSNVVLGLFLWLDCLAFRFWRLFYIYKLKKDPRTRKIYLFIPIFWLPIIILAIFGSGFNVFDNSTNMCIMYNSFLIALIIVAFLEILFIIVIAVLLRDIPHKAFNEYKTTIIISVISLFIFLSYNALLFLEKTSEIWGRILALSLMSFMFNFYFWMIIGPPIFRALKDWEGYEKEFKEQLAKDSNAAVQKGLNSASIKTSISAQPLDP